MISANLTFNQGICKMNMKHNLADTKTPTQLAQLRIGVLLIVLSSFILASCANGSTQKETNDANQSKRRTIVSYLA
jgi:hypothetical protein